MNKFKIEISTTAGKRVFIPGGFPTRERCQQYIDQHVRAYKKPEIVESVQQGENAGCKL